MLMGVFSGTLSLVLLFAVHPLTMPWFLAAVAVASLYWFGLVFAAFLPGTAWLDPELEAEIGHPLGLNPQQFVSYVLLFFTRDRHGVLAALAESACMTVNGRTPTYPIDPLSLERWSPRVFSAAPMPLKSLMMMFEAARWAASSYK